MSWHGRRASSIENQSLRVTVLHEGGHIAEMLDKASGVNPLWTPPWPSIEPSSHDTRKHPEYGDNVESKLLAGIAGHNLCLDIFGGPSADEAAAGIGVHGEGSVAAYEIEASAGRLKMTACFPIAQIRFERTIELCRRTVEIGETVESLAAFDRPIGWTQHVTLGPPFLECGITRFESSATRSKTFESAFGANDYLEPGAEFDWPVAPGAGGGSADLRRFGDKPSSSAFTAHLMDPGRDEAFFTAFHPALDLTFGYTWRRSDFPWLGIWEENRSRRHAPWNGGAIARGMEFGVSPMPETRRQMVDRGTLFGVPTFRWLPAHGRLEARYAAGFETGTR
ncbi:MAG TPA: hypothetical protein VKB88_17545 [Bryobacteraceae bacterium]|nr:hypothetical protein [Bryobacteraceae bacterium]